VDKFCWIPSALHISFANIDVNPGLWSKMICLGIQTRVQGVALNESKVWEKQAVNAKECEW